jgi:hypothetical protein
VSNDVLEDKGASAYAKEPAGNPPMQTTGAAAPPVEDFSEPLAKVCGGNGVDESFLFWGDEKVLVFFSLRVHNHPHQPPLPPNTNKRRAVNWIRLKPSWPHVWGSSRW